MAGKIAVSILKEHPRNNEFFNDIEGEEWEEFLESIHRMGVMQPIVVTEDNVIVSGHQRYHACQALGINEIPYVRLPFTDEKNVLTALIECNLRSRNGLKPSAKLWHAIDTLRELRGIGEAGIGDAEANNAVHDLYNEFHLDQNTIRRSKKISTMSDEVQEAVENGVITARTAIDVIAKLSDDEQIKLLQGLDSFKKYTAKQIQDRIDKFKAEEVPDADDITALQDTIELLKTENENLRNANEDEAPWDKIAEAQNKERLAYEEAQFAKRRADDLESQYAAEIEALKDKYQKDIESKSSDYERRIEKMEELLEESDSAYDAVRFKEIEAERDKLIGERDNAKIKMVMDAVSTMTSMMMPIISSSGQITNGDVRGALRSIMSAIDTLESVRDRLGAAQRATVV